MEVRTLMSMPDLNAAMAVFSAIWGFRDGVAPISAEEMRAMAFAGNYVAGAFLDDTMVGASVGFTGVRDGHWHLHSHISGVLPDWQSKAIGMAIKQHQRSWALERDIGSIEWTFDPLVRRNAYFNLVKLGADVVGFEANFYGEMNDAINAGDPTDRAVVSWDLRKPSPGVDRDGHVILKPDHGGTPVVDKSDAPVVRVWVPADIVELRSTAPDSARAWRLALRETFGAAVADGYRATSMSRDGYYTLERSP